MSYEIAFYALFFRSHFFVQYGFIQVCIFYLFFWKTSFLSFCAFCVFCLSWIRPNLNQLLHHLCNHYLYSRWQVLCVFTYNFSIQLNNLWEQIHAAKTWLQLLIKNHASRELLSFKNSICKEKCATFTKWESVKETLSANNFFWENLRSRSFILNLWHWYRSNIIVEITEGLKMRTFFKTFLSKDAATCQLHQASG